MRRFLLSIGILTLAFAGTAHASQSSSYILNTDFENAATETAATSPSFSLTDGEVTWYRVPSASSNFQIVPLMGTVSSSSSTTSSSSTGGTSGGTDAGTGTRPSGGYQGNPNFSSSSSMSSSSSANERTGGRYPGSPVIRSSVGLSSSTTSTYRLPSRSRSAEGFHGAASSTGIESQLQSTYAPANLMSPNINVGHGSAPEPARMNLLLLVILSITVFVAIFSSYESLFVLVRTQRYRSRLIRLFILLSIILAALLGGFIARAYAAQTVPEEHIYNGRLLNASGVPVTTAHSVRFSYWKSADALSSDINGSGAIDTAATNYAQWQEVHTVTPNSSGYFSVELGSITPIPSYKDMPVATVLDLFLQVEVKTSTSPDTSYEILDVDSTDAGVDRSSVLSVPFASNADTIDQREIGTGSGAIPFLGSGAKLPVSVMPSGTQADEFILDANDSESSTITLQFGAALAKKISFDITNGTFVFNDDVKVEGNLVVTGLINGINVAQLQSSTGALKASSGGGLNLNVAFGSYRLNGNTTNYAGGTIILAANATQYVFFGSGGLTASTLGFPTDESMIPLAQTITNATAITSVLDRRVLSSDDREQDRTVTFNPEFEKASYQGDASDNVGQLSISHDNITLKNFYLWTSTKSSLQDYDMLLRIPVSPDFVRWQAADPTNALAIMYRSTSANAANNKLDIQVYDTNGNPVSLSGSTTNLVGTSWSEASIEFASNATWTAGQDMLVRLKVYAKDNFQMHIGSVKLKYTDFTR